MTKVLGYLRVSSEADCGHGKTSLQRQEQAINGYVHKQGLRVDKSCLFSDIGVSGTAPVERRLGFMKMLDYARAHKIDQVIFEDASRLARCVVVQELALQLLQELNITAVSVANPEHFLHDDDSPHTKLVRQLIGAISEFHRSETVTRLRKGRDINLAKSTKYTMSGSPKLGGKPNLEKGDLAKIRQKLFEKGISTANGEIVSHS
ncbi:cisA [Symbiodinium pilosum]|uniref:CisA protein n=1 Tax=Symbiodinium pilosum TaxID=2952 RepID=A0A812MEE6_SYMPI|nr:cisA [Symbiodinium pilosum]